MGCSGYFGTNVKTFFYVLYLSNGEVDKELFHFKGKRPLIDDGVFIDSIEIDLLKSLIGDYVTNFMFETN